MGSYYVPILGQALEAQALAPALVALTDPLKQYQSWTRMGSGRSCLGSSFGLRCTGYVAFNRSMLQCPYV